MSSLLQKLAFLVTTYGLFSGSVVNAQLSDPGSRVAIDSNGEWRALDQTCPNPVSDVVLSQRLVDVATEEWKRFGFQVIDHRFKSALNKIIRPSGGNLIDDKYNPKSSGVIRQGLRLGLMEDESRVRKAIGGYWSAVPNWDGYAGQSSVFRRFDDAGWIRPWSAAFVSYVVCQSGISEMEKFRRSAAHRDYVDQAIDANSTGDMHPIFRARDINGHLPTPGDLLCSDRASSSSYYKGMADRAIDRDPNRPMHCDFVVAVRPKAGYVAVLGGNVLNSVSITLVGVQNSKNGPRIQTANDATGARPWFVILELKNSSQADINNSPSIKNLIGSGG